MTGQRSTERRRQRAGGAGRMLPALLCALLPLVAGARVPGDEGEGNRQPQENPGRKPSPQQVISLDQAIAIAERRYQARVVRASTTEVDGRRYHVLRMLSDEGRVWTVRIDAATGQER